MGKFDDRPKVDIEVRDGKIVLDGKELDLQQGSHKDVRFRVTKLCRRNYNTVYDGTVISTVQISGLAKTEDRLKIVGMPDRTNTVVISIKGIEAGLNSEDHYLAWTANMGFISGMWEIDSSDQWYLTCYVPTEIIERLIADYDAGRIVDLAVGVKTNLWSAWSPFPNAGPVDWHMLADKFGGTAGADGKVEFLHWSDVPLESLSDQVEDEELEDAVSKDQAPAKAPDSPLADIMRAGTEASARLAKTWAWGMPTIVILLAIIAARM